MFCFISGPWQETWEIWRLGFQRLQRRIRNWHARNTSAHARNARWRVLVIWTSTHNETQQRTRGTTRRASWDASWGSSQGISRGDSRSNSYSKVSLSLLANKSRHVTQWWLCVMMLLTGINVLSLDTSEANLPYQNHPRHMAEPLNQHLDNAGAFNRQCLATQQGCLKPL